MNHGKSVLIAPAKEFEAVNNSISLNDMGKD